MLLLAGPGVIMATMATAVFAKYGLDYNWDWSTAVTFGAMLSATDPVAVVRLRPSTTPRPVPWRFTPPPFLLPLLVPFPGCAAEGSWGKQTLELAH